MAADPDGGTEAAAAQDGSAEAASAVDATTGPQDATVAPVNDAAMGSEASEPAEGGGGVAYVQPDGALPPYSAGNVYDLLCVKDPAVAFFDFASVKAPYTDAAGCMAYKRTATGHAAAFNCLCQNCFTLQQQCDALPGCQEIQKCGLDTGCTDANSCYLVQGKCVTPINNWGTGSVSTALSQMLEACGKAANPACPSQ
jgi:hypothetical protein